MNPVGHALVAVLPVVAYELVRHRRLPREWLVLVSLFASQFPDLVDKPLAWLVGVTSSGRLVAHSLLVALPLVAVVALAAFLRGRSAYGLAFAYGYLSHLATDFDPVLAQGTEYYYFPNMLWPLLEPNPDRGSGAGQELLGGDFLVDAAVLAALLGYVAVGIVRRPR